MFSIPAVPFLLSCWHHRCSRLGSQACHSAERTSTNLLVDPLLKLYLQMAVLKGTNVSPPLPASLQQCPPANLPSNKKAQDRCSVMAESVVLRTSYCRGWWACCHHIYKEGCGPLCPTQAYVHWHMAGLQEDTPVTGLKNPTGDSEGSF